MCRKDPCDAVLEATWEVREAVVRKRKQEDEAKKKRKTYREHLIILKVCT